jgi:single-strand DNA-binding protein
MNNLNSILVEGNLVRDPELNHTQKGTPVCKFSIATNRFFKLDDEYQREVSFFDVTTWARLAEVCNEFLKKGRGVRIIGRLKQDRWKGMDGKGKSKVYIIADNVEFKPVFSNKQTKTETNQAEKTELKAAVSY